MTSYLSNTLNRASGAIFGMPRLDSSGKAAFWICVLLICFISDSAFAHERWILTPEQIADWNTRPLPRLFSEFTAKNVTMISAFLVFIVGWIRLGFTGARELFPDLQARLGSYGYLVAPVLRFCLAWILISSAFGLEPRYGVERLASPTLFAPDLELGALQPDLTGMRWLELVLGIGFLLGTYVRVCAVGLLLLTLIGTLLFQSSIYAYAGALIGVAIYLLCQGPGSLFLPLPAHPSLLETQAQLAAVPRQRAQAIMRVLTGFNIFYLAVAFKVFQPNLAIAILTLHDVRLFGFEPDTFTLLMTLVEFSSGILIIAGILLRPLSLFFLSAFLLFAALLPESWMAHALFYGVMLSFLFNGAGRFAMPEAQDKAANIVIIGGTVAAIHAAMKIERLIGQYTRVTLTLIHDQPNILFYPLLPEVIGGTMQPGNAVNPIRRVLPQTRVILGEVSSIDTGKQQLTVRRSEDRLIELPYDQIVLALFPVPRLSGLPGLMAHASPINSVGDALHIRKRIMDRIEEAELEPVREIRDRLLTFAVIGSGQRACSTAVEICEMLETAKSSYAVLRDEGWKVCLYEDSKVPFSDFESEIRAKRDAELSKAGVGLFSDREVAAITPDSLVFSDGQRQTVGFVVNASFTLPQVIIDGQSHGWPLPTDECLRFAGDPRIWVTARNASGAGLSRYLTTSDWMDLGRAAGQNAWAASQEFDIQPFAFKRRWLMSFNMGRRSICRLGGLLFGGLPAWFFSRMANLATMPGLERNLRILIDWTLDVPFRADIAVLAPDATQKLQKIHMEAGDEVIREGEDGDSAYIIQSGRLEVLKGGKKVGELGAGDFFGEIALVQNVKRNATVRCLVACELTALSRDDFQALSLGSSTLAKAIQQQISERTGKKKRTA